MRKWRACFSTSAFASAPFQSLSQVSGISHLPPSALTPLRPPFNPSLVKNALEESVRRKVGGSLANLPPLARLEMLRRNAWLLRGGKWRPPTDDGTLVRKTLGVTR